MIKPPSPAELMAVAVAASRLRIDRRGATAVVEAGLAVPLYQAGDTLLVAAGAVEALTARPYVTEHPELALQLRVRPAVAVNDPGLLHG